MITEKLLTISVAAYNGAETLAKALDSCLIKTMDQLEILVVDDGSTDDTASIAKRYVQVYPDVFRLIQQENGGYGTTINRTVAEAKGKYYRTLDCDDWFSRPALQALVEELQNCKADAVVTDYQTVCKGKVQNRYCVCDGFTRGVLYKSSSFKEFPSMEMHALTFRTEMLRRADIDLPAHCNYTDMLYTFCAMAEVETMAFCPVTLYNYLLGRDGQSVSLENYQKHMDEYINVTFIICGRAASCCSNSAKDNLLRLRAVSVAQEGIETIFKFPLSKQNKRYLAEYDRRVLDQFPRLAKDMKNKDILLLRKTKYCFYSILWFWKNFMKRIIFERDI